jgi:phosphoglycolate phosphatase
VVAGDTLATCKPDPEGLLLLASSLDTDVDGTVLVGDSAVDARTAAAAGCRLVLVNWGFTRREDLQQLAADVHASEVAALRAALLGL